MSLLTAMKIIAEPPIQIDHGAGESGSFKHPRLLEKLHGIQNSQEGKSDLKCGGFRSSRLHQGKQVFVARNNDSRFRGQRQIYIMRIVGITRIGELLWDDPCDRGNLQKILNERLSSWDRHAKPGGRGLGWCLPDFREEWFAQHQRHFLRKRAPNTRTTRAIDVNEGLNKDVAVVNNFQRKTHEP
ncbi:MAG TPA: hypothetical protein VFC78_10625 [Tepidisphaeraceae bacterium]|nr:hypothetical protein [Tepidisphaeraceae bacterium]